MVAKKGANMHGFGGIPELHIKIDEDGIPQYVFSGAWNVREILKVERTLGRKYREYMKLCRRPQL